MTSFVVFNDGWDWKSAILHPDIIGPFGSIDEAAKFIEQHPRHDGHGGIEPSNGGYAGAHVVSAEYAEDPEQWLAKHPQQADE